MSAAHTVILAICLLVISSNAHPRFRHPMFHPKGFRPHIIPVPVHPYPVYGPGPRRGFGDGLTLLTSAALLGTGNPAAQALGGLGLFSLG